MTILYDFEPLERMFRKPVAHHNDGALRDFAALLGIDSNRVAWYRKAGMSAEKADRFACRVGLHPSLLWPTWFDDAFDEPLCLWCREPAPFNAVYCRSRCADSMNKWRKVEARKIRKFHERLDRYRDSVDPGGLHPPSGPVAIEGSMTKTKTTRVA